MKRLRAVFSPIPGPLSPIRKTRFPACSPGERSTPSAEGGLTRCTTGGSTGSFLKNGYPSRLCCRIAPELDLRWFARWRSPTAIVLPIIRAWKVPAFPAATIPKEEAGECFARQRPVARLGRAQGVHKVNGDTLAVADRGSPGLFARPRCGAAPNWPNWKKTGKRA